MVCKSSITLHLLSFSKAHAISIINYYVVCKAGGGNCFFGHSFKSENMLSRFESCSVSCLADEYLSVDLTAYPPYHSGIATPYVSWIAE